MTGSLAAALASLFLSEGSVFLGGSVDTFFLVSLFAGIVFATLGILFVDFNGVDSFFVGLVFEEVFGYESEGSATGFLGAESGFLGLLSADSASPFGGVYEPPFSGPSLLGVFFLMTCFFKSFLISPTEGRVLGGTFALPLASTMVTFGGIIIL